LKLRSSCSLGVFCQGTDRARQHSNECYPHDDQTAPRSKSHAANTERQSDKDVAAHAEMAREGHALGARNAGMHVSSGMNTKCRSNRDVAGKYRKYVVFAAGKRRRRRNGEAVGAAGMLPASAGCALSGRQPTRELPGAALWERGARGAARDGSIFEGRGIQGWMLFTSREGCFMSPASTGTYASDRPSSICPIALTGPSYSVPRGIV
jgi:hypothetical protein